MNERMKTSTETIGLIITAITSMAGTYLIGWWKYRQVKLELKTKEKKELLNQSAAMLSVDGLKSQAYVAHQMQKISDLGFGRVLIVMIQNDGKIPRPGSKLYAHALSPVSVDLRAAREISNRYDGVEVDADYTQFCAMLAADNSYVHRIEVPYDIDPAQLTLIQGWYRSEGILESNVYHLATDVYCNEEKQEEHFRMFILSAAVYKNQDKKIKDINLHETERLVSLIRQKYHRFYRHVNIDDA